MCPSQQLVAAVDHMIEFGSSGDRCLTPDRGKSTTLRSGPHRDSEVTPKLRAPTTRASDGSKSTPTMRGVELGDGRAV